VKIYAVYVNPPDYRNKAVVRRWCLRGSGPYTDLLIVTDTLDEARDVFQRLKPYALRLFALDTDPNDPNEPHLVEVWI
jgi:hypothetical protein